MYLECLGLDYVMLKLNIITSVTDIIFLLRSRANFFMIRLYEIICWSIVMGYLFYLEQSCD